MNTHITPLHEATRERIIKRMMRENDFTLEMATAVLNEALVYMHAANADETGIGPSKLVDVGWHTFILYTWEYAQYCQMAFGHFLHHSPSDYEGAVDQPLQATVDFFEANGITYDPELWGARTECNKCDPRCGGENCGRDPRIAEAKCRSNPGPGCKNTCAECGRKQAPSPVATVDCNGSGGWGCQGGPGCGTQVDPRTPCDPVLAFAEPRGEIRTDCDGGRGGGPSMCGKGNCS